MEVDPPQDPPSKPEMLQGFNSGQLPSYVSKLSGSSRGIPFDKDFHFYRNFDEFKSPIKEIEKKSQVLLAKIGSSENLWGKKMDFPEDLDDAYDWLVNVNDEVFERFDVSVDEFRSARRKEEETGVRVMSPVDLENGFQMVYGKKSKKGHSVNQAMEEAVHAGENLMEVKVASRDAKAMGTVKPKIPFHIPTIPRPQDQYKILVNNSNQPFEHVWLQRSEDGSKFIHPLENLSVLDFVDKNITDVEPIKPLPVECTPFKHVVEVKDLKELAAKLRAVDEFAVDLEHNQYRSFQGLTCLMQISTRTEDFVVDTLKLRVHIGPYLREVFKDPTKRKVLHGADRDILWLQRDFSIYVCNMFDTGQASRVLKLERNSLEHLLQHFCGVTANKEYQNADWRLRPLPSEMLRYAREDTHYLLHIYDLMKRRLLSLSNELDDTDSPLIEVYKRSYDICMQLYEKDILTDSSYLYIYGLHGANFNARQLAVVAGLCEWRDVVARAEDESTGYILPNKTLLDIAKQMPYTTYNLRRLVKSKHPYVEHNLDSVVSIIRHSILNEAAFEDAAKRLKEARIEMASQLNTANTDGSQPEANPELGTSSGEGNVSEAGNAANYNLPKHHLKGNSSIGQPSPNRQVKTNIEGSVPGEGPTLSGHIKEKDTITNTKASNLATVQLLKKPSRAFGALLGNSAKRKFDTENKEKEEKKLEQIKSSVNLPFHSFPELSAQHSPPNRIEPPARLTREEQVAEAEAEAAAEPKAEAEAEAEAATTSSKMVDIILLDSDSDQEGTPKADENMSLSDLSSSFQKCFQSKQGGGGGKSADSSGFLQLEPFDYEAARKQVRFGETRRGGGDEQEVGRRRGGGGGRKKINALGHELKDGDDGEMTSDLPQGRRRQAFPATGNRSATFL